VSTSNGFIDSANILSPFSVSPLFIFPRTLTFVSETERPLFLFSLSLSLSFISRSSINGDKGGDDDGSGHKRRLLQRAADLRRVAEVRLTFKAKTFEFFAGGDPFKGLALLDSAEEVVTSQRVVAPEPNLSSAETLGRESARASLPFVDAIGEGAVERENSRVGKQWKRKVPVPESPRLCPWDPPAPHVDCWMVRPMVTWRVGLCNIFSELRTKNTH